MAATTAPQIPKLSFVDIFRSTKQLQRQYAREKDSKEARQSDKKTKQKEGDKKTKESRKTKTASDAAATVKDSGPKKASCSHKEAKRELQGTRSSDSSAPPSPSSKPAKKKITPQSQWCQEPLFLNPFLAARHLHPHNIQEPVSAPMPRHDVGTGRAMPVAVCQHHQHPHPQLHAEPQSQSQPQPQPQYQIQQLDGTHAYVPGAFPHFQLQETGIPTPALSPQPIAAPIAIAHDAGTKTGHIPENDNGLGLPKTKTAASPPPSTTPLHAWTVEQDTCLEQLKLKGSSWRAIEQTLNIAKNECRMRYAELKRIKKEKEEKEDHTEDKSKDNTESEKRHVSSLTAPYHSFVKLVLPSRLIINIDE